MKPNVKCNLILVNVFLTLIALISVYSFLPVKQQDLDVRQKHYSIYKSVNDSFDSSILPFANEIRNAKMITFDPLRLLIPKHRGVEYSYPLNHVIYPTGTQTSKQ